jgi:hypothetical protein
VTIGSEQHESRVGLSDAQLDPSLRRAHRLVGEHFHSHLLGPECERTILIVRGNADKLHMGDHQASLCSQHSATARLQNQSGLLDTIVIIGTLLAAMLKTIMFDAYLVDTLMPDLVGHDGQPSAFLVYLYLWSQSRTVRLRAVPASYTQIAIGTGLSRSAVQAAVTTLKRRQLIAVRRGSPTAIPEYSVLRPWRR